MFIVDAEGVADVAKGLGEGAGAGARELFDGLDDGLLNGRREPSGQGATRGRERQVETPRVVRGALPRHQTLGDQLRHDDGNGALIGGGAPGQLVHGERGVALQLVQDEELRGPQAVLLESGAIGQSKRFDDRAKGVENVVSSARLISFGHER